MRFPVRSLEEEPSLNVPTKHNQPASAQGETDIVPANSTLISQAECVSYPGLWLVVAVVLARAALAFAKRAEVRDQLDATKPLDHLVA
jgi:hypothetical protein